MERASRQCGAAARLSVLKQRKGILGVSVYRGNIPLPLPLGEVAERSEGGEGKQ